MDGWMNPVIQNPGAVQAAHTDSLPSQQHIIFSGGEGEEHKTTVYVTVFTRGGKKKSGCSAVLAA